MRLPLAPVRWLVIGVILAVNLAICVARTQWLQAAPINLLAADVVAARDQAANLRVAFLFSEAQDALMPVEGRYYLYLFSGEETYPSEFAGGDGVSRFAIPRASTTRRMVESLRQGPRTDRLIVWDKLPAPPYRTPTSPDVIVPEPATDDLLALLPGRWTGSVPSSIRTTPAGDGGCRATGVGGSMSRCRGRNRPGERQRICTSTLPIGPCSRRAKASGSLVNGKTRSTAGRRCELSSRCTTSR